MVNIKTRLQAENSGVVQIWAWTKDVSFPKQPGQFWGTPSIISDGYHALYPVVKLTTHLNFEPWLRMKRAISLLHHMASRYARDLTVIRKNNFWILYNVVSIALIPCGIYSSPLQQIVYICNNRFVLTINQHQRQ